METTSTTSEFGANEFKSVMTLVKHYFDGLHHGNSNAHYLIISMSTFWDC